MILWQLDLKYNTYILDLFWIDVDPVLNCGIRRCITLQEYHLTRGEEIYKALYLMTLEMLNFLKVRDNR